MNALQASAAYKASHALDQRPAAVLAAAHEEIASQITSAIVAYEAGVLDRMCRHAARAANLLSALIASVQGHSPEADALARAYGRLRTAINRMSMTQDDMKTIREGLDWMRKLTRSFLSEMGMK